MKNLALIGLLAGSALAVGFRPVPRTSSAGGVEIGQEAPDFEIAEWRNFPEGASTLADLRGRVVLLDFWRTW
jgi:hypothetical protein